MNANSLLAYYKGTYSGRFSQKRFEVLDYITKHPNLTRQMISERMKVPINCITGRVCELLDAGLVDEIKANPRNMLVSNFQAPVYEVA